MVENQAAVLATHAGLIAGLIAGPKPDQNPALNLAPKTVPIEAIAAAAATTGLPAGVMARVGKADKASVDKASHKIASSPIHQDVRQAHLAHQAADKNLAMQTTPPPVVR